MQTDTTTPKIIGLTIERFYRFFLRELKQLRRRRRRHFQETVDLLIKTTALHLHHAF